MKILIIAAAFLMSFCSVSASAEVIEGSSHWVEKGGETYSTDISNYTESGSWEDSEFCGYDNMKVRVTNEYGASAVWTKAPAQLGNKQEIYIWKNVQSDGDTNADVHVSTNTESINKTIDFSRGYSGWTRIGVVNLPDTFITASVTASGNGVLPICAFKYVKTDDDEFYADRIFDKNDDLMIMKQDFSNCLYNHEYLFFEDTNPTVINDKMMIPIRFVTEHMGAEVLWDSYNNSVTVKKDDTEIVFTVNSVSCSINGENKLLEQAPIIVNSRTLIPLRAMSEGLGYQVDWQEGGLVLIGKTITYDTSLKDKCIDSLNIVLSR